MSRPLRIDVPGGVAHVTARGNNRQPIFRTVEQRDHLVAILGRVVERYGWLCHAYVVMDNHYHLLLETPLPNLSRGMRQLNGLYAQWFNRRHNRTGHLFGGRFKSVVVERDEHFLETVRYIVLNPLRTALPVRFTHWRWSSYAATAGLAPVPSFLTIDGVLAMFDRDRAVAQQRYVGFVADGLGASLEARVIGEIYFGSEDFVRDLMPGVPIAEIPRLQWEPLRPSLDLLCRKPEGILTAYRRYGYRLREIGDHLGLHPATVSRALARLEQAAADPAAPTRTDATDG